MLVIGVFVGSTVEEDITPVDVIFSASEVMLPKVVSLLYSL